MQIEIEKGIPLPNNRTTGATQVFKSLGIGDSVVLPFSPGIYAIAAQIGIKVKMKKEGINLMRVWRVL